MSCRLMSFRVVSCRVLLVKRAAAALATKAPLGFTRLTLLPRTLTPLAFTMFTQPTLLPLTFTLLTTHSHMPLISCVPCSSCLPPMASCFSSAYARFPLFHMWGYPVQSYYFHLCPFLSFIAGVISIIFIFIIQSTIPMHVT